MMFFVTVFVYYLLIFYVLCINPYHAGYIFIYNIPLQFLSYYVVVGSAVAQL